MPLLRQKCYDHTMSLSMFLVLARLMSKGASSRMRIVLESNAWCRPSEKQANKAGTCCRCLWCLVSVYQMEGRDRQGFGMWGACHVTSKQKTSLELRQKL